MDRKELDKDLDEYIAERKRSHGFGSFFSFLKKDKSVSKDVELPPAVEAYHEEEVEEQQGKQGWFSRLFRRDELRESNEECTVAEQPVVSETDLKKDMKAVAMAALQAIKQMPSEQRDEFKKTYEFSQLKDILKKHNLIR